MFAVNGNGTFVYSFGSTFFSHSWLNAVEERSGGWAVGLAFSINDEHFFVDVTVEGNNGPDVPVESSGIVFRRLVRGTNCRLCLPIHQLDDLGNVGSPLSGNGGDWSGRAWRAWDLKESLENAVWAYTEGGN